MPRKQVNDGMEITYQDLSQFTAALEVELYDRLIYELMNRQQTVVFGDSFKVSFVDATHVQVAAGNGVQLDNTQTDPEPKTRLLYLSTASSQVIAAADASHNRIDIVCMKHNRATSATSNRNQKDPTSGIVTVVANDVESDWSATLQVVTGTPSASPAVPSVPSGYMKLAEVLVTAVTGVSGSSAITDKRQRYGKPTGYRNIRAVAAAATIDFDDEVIIADLTGGAFALTLPTASTMGGKLITVMKKDSSANVLTLTGTISGENNPTVDAQYSSVQILCDGTNYYWL